MCEHLIYLILFIEIILRKAKVISLGCFKKLLKYIRVWVLGQILLETSIKSMLTLSITKGDMWDIDT